MNITLDTSDIMQMLNTIDRRLDRLEKKITGSELVYGFKGIRDVTGECFSTINKRLKNGSYRNVGMGKNIIVRKSELFAI
jgi:hypothetical protein